MFLAGKIYGVVGDCIGLFGRGKFGLFWREKGPIAVRRAWKSNLNGDVFVLEPLRPAE